MIRSTQTTLRFANTGKREQLARFVDEYTRVVRLFVGRMWETEKVSRFVSCKNDFDTWLSARIIQSAGSMASGIVRGTRRKQSQRLWKINQFKKLGMPKKARKLQAVYDHNKVSKPNVTHINPEIDARFVKIDLDNVNSFDGWLTLASLGYKTKIALPFRRTAHFNKMLAAGKIKAGVRISKDTLTVLFELPAPKPAVGKTVGIDVGLTTIMTCNDGQAVNGDRHGHTYQSICEKLARRKRGSNGFKQAQEHRKNFIRWSVNQLDLDGIGRVRLERIKNLRRGRRSSRLLSRWNYADLFARMEAKLGDSGVQIVKTSPTYTSQRCSACGWVRKGNRKGKRFKCDKCSFECDADLNGSLNISVDLPPISKAERLRHANRKGFYWLVKSGELLVPHAQ
jgi:transposase